MAIVNVNSKTLREYLEALQRWLIIFDEIDDNYNNISKRIKLERDKVDSENNKIISEKNKRYIEANNRLSEYLSFINESNGYNDSTSETIHSLNENIQKCLKDLEYSKNIKNHISNIFNDTDELYQRNKNNIELLKERVSDLVKKSVLNLGEFADITDSSDENIRNVGYVVTGTSNVNGIVCRNLSSAVNTSQEEFISNSVSKCLQRNDHTPCKCYKNDIKHIEIEGLDETKQTWQTQGEYSVFNTPDKTGEKLDSNQGKLNTFLGTCGCVSCVNVLRLAGIDVSEEELVTYAATHENEQGEALCSYGSSDYAANGGTTVMDRKNILEAYGVKSKLVFPSIENIFKEVSQGKGVIASVHASFLYNGEISDKDRHAVTITSVKYKNNKPYSVIICDSNGMPSEEYHVGIFKTALTGNMLNVTEKIIR